MAKKPAAKTPAKPTRTTQDAPSSMEKANDPRHNQKPQEGLPNVAAAATAAASTEPSPVAASEPAFPDLHCVTDSEHGILHRLRATASAEGSGAARRKVIKAIDTDLHHPVVQNYKTALLEWLAA